MKAKKEENTTDIYLNKAEKKITSKSDNHMDKLSTIFPSKFSWMWINTYWILCLCTLVVCVKSTNMLCHTNTYKYMQ